MSPFSFPSVSLAVMTTERGLTGVDQSFSGSEMSHLANSFMWKLQNLSGHLWKPQSSETTARFLFVLGVLFCFVLFLQEAGWALLSLIGMLTNLSNANIRVSSWLLKGNV